MSEAGAKLPPQNLEAEQSVLGALLIDKEAVTKVVEFLHPESFYREAHHWIYQAIINLFNSKTATHMFVNPGTYYDPPTRQFSYDLNFQDPAKQPPGIPCALVLVRLNWAVPPPNIITYNVTP